MARFFVSLLFIVLSEYIMCCSSSCSSRSYACNEDSTCFSEEGFANNEGIQLLIPSWNFTCQGSIENWFAHVQGNKSVAGLLEFQIFKPETVDANSNAMSYTLLHGNEYQGNNEEGSLIQRPVSFFVDPYLLPIRPGYIVGVYLPPSTAQQHTLELMYEDGGDTDVYYWTGVQNRKCQYALCSGKVKKGVNLFVGWEFVEAALNQVETTLALIKEQLPLYCEGSVQECIESNSSISSVLQTSSSPIYTQSSSLPSPSVSSLAIMMSAPSIEQVSNNPSSSPSSVGDNMTGSFSFFGASGLQLGLFGAVLILMVLILALLISLIVIFLACRRRKRSHSIVLAEKELTSDNPPSHRGHVSTGVNPSYKTLHVTVSGDHDENIQMDVKPKTVNYTKQINATDCSEIYAEIDDFQETSRKDYMKVTVADYCVPQSLKHDSLPDNQIYEIMYSDNRMNELISRETEHDDYCTMTYAN